MADLRNEFSWSKSRDEVFRACRRQYYYQYYGAWGGWSERADARTRTLYVLKQLQTRQQWLGSTVHNCLRWILTGIRKHGQAPAEELALQHLARRLQVDFQNSGEGVYWEKPKGTCALIEHEYDDLDVPDDAWEELFEKALRCVSAFYHSTVFDDLLAQPRDRWLELEDLASFTLEGIRVWVQLDCAHRTDDGARLYDWKTGRSQETSTKEQLALYTLYAASRWQLDPDRITAVEFNLGEGHLVDHQASPQERAAAQERVRTSAAAMRALLDDAEANTASEERFPLAEGDAPCRWCGFRRACPRWAGADAGDATSS